MHGGTRASGTPGYDASADYVVERMQAAGYAVTTREFEVPFLRELPPPLLQQLAPTPTTYVPGEDVTSTST